MRWLFLLVAACSANDDIPAPQVASVTPDRAPAGAVVLVNGSYFCQRGDTMDEEPMCQTTGEVNFGASPGTISTWSDTAVMVEVPSGVEGGVSLSVVVGGRPSNPIAFTID